MTARADAFDPLRASRLTRLCTRCVAVFLLVILGSLFVVAVVDHISWSQNGYQGTPYHGSTLRSFRELARPAYEKDDSWLPMIEALKLLQSPDGDRLYEKVFFEDKIKFQYPPTSLIYFVMLDQIGLASLDELDTLNAINAVVLAISCAAFAYLVLMLLLPPAGGRFETRQWLLVVLLMLVALFFYPSLHAFAVGQIQVWINALFIFACIAWLRGAKITAGALIAIAATMKPQFGIFLIWALLWREWRFLRGFLVAGISVGAVSLLLFGLHNHVAYLDVLSFISKHGEAYMANHSVNGILNRAFGNGDNLNFEDHAFAPFDAGVATVTFVTSLAFVTIALLPAMASGQRKADIVDLAIVAICATIASPIAWEHHYGILLPLFGIALARLCAAQADRAALIWLAVSWILSTNFLPAANRTYDTAFNFVQAYLFFAAIILLAVFFYLRKRERPFEDAKSPTASLPEK
jgi:hypothetical protein